MKGVRFYAGQGAMTDPASYTDMFKGLPEDVPSLCKVVQSNFVHVFWAERYGLHLTEEQAVTLQIRDVAGKLAVMRGANGAPLTTPRPLEARQVGNCRDFSTLLCSMLRHQGVPARARCGFGTYFLPGHYEDHWVCEYWNRDENRWVMVDAQIDEFQKRALNIDFDTLDVPHDRFITGGRAWQMCRRGEVDPNDFGIQDMHGIWFIWGNVIRDLLAMNKVEILPWDGDFGLLTQSLEDPLPDEETLMLYDEIAAIPDAPFDKMRKFYLREERLRVPSEWLQKN